MKQLAAHDLLLSTGLATNLIPESVAGKAAIQASNMDGTGIFRGVSKSHGSSTLNSSPAGSIRSIHFFEFFDLDRVSKRRLVINTLDGATAGRLKTIDLSTGDLATLLDDDGTSEAFVAAEALASAIINHRLHLSSPNQKGDKVPTGGRKYDGTRITNWGVQAPGDQRTTLAAGQVGVDQDILDNVSDWTGSFTGGAATFATNSTNVIQGAGGLGVTPSGGTDTATLERNFAPTINIDPSGSTLIRVWLFVPSGGLTAITTVTVFFRSDAGANSSTFNFTRGQLVNGWNLLSMDFDSPSSITGAGVTRAACDQIRLILDFTAASVPARQWIWNFMHTLSKGDPNAAAGVSGGLGFDDGASGGTDNYSFRVTFLTEYGLESNAGPASNIVLSVAPRQITLTNIPLSADESVIARRIYGFRDGSGGYGFIRQIDDNTSPSVVLDTGDEIGLDSPPLAGDPDLDNSPPEPFLDAVTFNQRIFAVDAATRLNLLPSEVNQGEAFPLLNAIQVDQPITAIRDHPDGLHVYTTDLTFVLGGDGSANNPFTLELKNSELGANGPRAVASVQGLNIVVREKQVYLVTHADNPWYLNGAVQDQWDSLLQSTTLADMFCLSDRSHFRVVFFGKGLTGAYTELWVYQHTTQAISDVANFEQGVDPQDLRMGAWFKLALPATGISPLCATAGERTSEVPELWVGTDEGYVHYFQDPDTNNWFTGSGTVPVTATWESTAVPLGAGPAGRGEPRFLQLNFHNPASVGNSTWTATITLLSDADGAVLDTTSFQIAFVPGKSSPIVPVPFEGRAAEWCRLKLVNANVSQGGTFRHVKLYYLPRGDFAGGRSQ